MTTKRHKTTKRVAYKRYERWCKDGYPDLSVADTINVAIGYVVNCSDGRPDYDEQNLFLLLSKTLDMLSWTVSERHENEEAGQ